MLPLRIVAYLLSAASLISLALGYGLRILVSRGRRGSMELGIKQMMLETKDKEQKILEDAGKQAEEILKVARVEIKQKEDDNKKNEERLIKKDGLLDHRQTEIDKEVEDLKKRIEEIKIIRQNADQVESQKKANFKNLQNSLWKKLGWKS